LVFKFLSIFQAFPILAILLTSKAKAQSLNVLIHTQCKAQ